jgi:hypothetical protein
MDSVSAQDDFEMGIEYINNNDFVGDFGSSDGGGFNGGFGRGFDGSFGSGFDGGFKTGDCGFGDNENVIEKEDGLMELTDI